MGPIILHKTEWDRIKKQADPPTQPEHDTQHFKTSIEKSESRINRPDVVEDHVLQQAIKQKKKEQQINHDLALLKVNAGKKKQERTMTSIKKARQQIFEDSCYGKRLISALIESKTLEERQAQIQFKRELQWKALEEEEKHSILRPYCSFNLDEKESDLKHLQKVASVECVLTNKDMHENKLNEIAMNRNKDKLLEEEHVRLMKQLRIKEAYQEEKLKQSDKQAMKEYEIEQDKVRNQRIQREYQDEVRNELHRSHQQKVKYKIQQVYKQIHGDRQEKTTYKNVYKLMENCQSNNEKRYHLIDERIKEQEKLILKKTKEVNENLKQERMNVESNKNILIETKKKCRRHTEKKAFVCDRQCLITQSRKQTQKTFDREPIKDEEKQPTFLGPSNKLLEDLRKREKDQSPWSGANAAHKQFARHADEILQQCRYKVMARKVIDDYRRLNCLDSATLPIPHY